MSWHPLPFNPETLDEGDCKGFELAGAPYFLVKKFGQLYAYHNRCPHQQINLEWKADTFLDVDKSLIQCASHGALFTIKDGRCVAGPCTGQQLQALTLRKQDQQWQACVESG
ncbi:Rieske (2Fe-2S) protein [Pseudoteredinibacter isoporae]|uniref:Nitrite reductase/ring-hydroxylating ferredoxin subunit n=1 Tax=Pseudoteredinibacter isoporae TaxID=570281 RepID=A0A7X0JW89_9GAMM|nr:Rieske (2Fe-2S) protein [Pseudoteredinibacter isoporae]MBB6522974.1 nitrite reductase/ring-hydroxylating ferredoxin subunit [Pseudoteredinibacter isoporae]NHO88498.1 Rieske (2Fe-2S) protein [Pseudoteredinibacter isoporae]NIB22103.1 Rieske (2Fe-2S) protein [Pseudoteredinibacter isoporae]